METNATAYKKVLKKVADVIASNEVEVSLNNYADNFNVSVFVNEGDKKESIFSAFFYTSDSDRGLEAKCAGFMAIVDYLKNH